MAPAASRSGRGAVAAPGGGSRFTAIALAVGVGLALVFSIAFGSKGVAQHAKALHAADEALRAATVARAQVGTAAHLVVLQQEMAFDALASAEVAMRDTRFALDDLASAVADLEAHDAEAAAGIESAAAGFSAAVGEILGLAEAGDAAGLRAALGESFDHQFRVLTDAVVVERDFQASKVAAADDTMGRVGDIARFLVAFVVPLSAIIVYRELTRRQHRQKELEVRLETEQELGKARDEFVANASHELRTPLTSIFGMAHLLEEDEAVRTSPAALEMLDLIISEAHDLNRMVDDLLTTARLDAGALHYQFESVSVVPEVIEEVVEPLRRAGTSVEVDCRPGLVRSDRLRLRQVVRNLLSNAGKYGGPRIHLAGAEVDGWYELRVEDDGEGIPPELEARLFQRFLHRGDVPLVLGSVGLGLSIVRALAEGMGGAVWYERRRGWTCFVVRIPLAVAAEVSRFREAVPRAAGQAAPTVVAAGVPATAAGASESASVGAEAHRAAEALRAHVRRR